jgi:hypothetical protein
MRQPTLGRRGRGRPRVDHDKGPRGRPEGSVKALKNDPDRHLIAYFIARQMAFPVDSPTELARDLMMIHHSQINSREEAEALAGALLKGQMAPLQPKGGKHRGRDDPNAERWSDRGWANAWADNFMRKYRTVSKKLTHDVGVHIDPADPASDRLKRIVEAEAAEPASNLHWLIQMVTAWQIILDPSAYVYTGRDPLTVAHDFVAGIGENDYFERVMKPYPRLFPKSNFA